MPDSKPYPLINKVKQCLILTKFKIKYKRKLQIVFKVGFPAKKENCYFVKFSHFVKSAKFSRNFASNCFAKISRKSNAKISRKKIMRKFHEKNGSYAKKHNHFAKMQNILKRMHFFCEKRELYTKRLHLYRNRLTIKKLEGTARHRII